MTHMRDQASKVPSASSVSHGPHLTHMRVPSVREAGRKQGIKWAPSYPHEGSGVRGAGRKQGMLLTHRRLGDLNGHSSTSMLC